MEIKLLIKTYQQRKPTTDGFVGYFYQTLKKNISHSQNLSINRIKL